MSARPRIAYLTPNALFPTNRGGRIRAHHLWRALSAHGEVTPILVGDVESPATRSLLRPTGARFFPRRRFRAGMKALPGLFEALDPGDAPGQNLDDLAAPEALARHCLNPARIERILSLLMRLRPQLVVLCDTSLGLLAPHVRALGVATVVGPHNYDSALYAAIAERAPTPALRSWNALAARAFAAAERIIAAHVDQLWVCSGADARRFGERLVAPAKIRVMPNVYDVEAATPMDPESRDLVFVGQAQYLPNEDAIRNLFAISQTLARGVSHRLRIVGRVTDAIRAQARAHPSVDLIGPTPSVAPFVLGAALAPIPLTLGGGTRLKILEAMALARPVLSTPVGIEGIDYEPGVEAVVEPDLAAFPDRIESLLGDREQRQRIAQAGWELARRRYSHEALRDQVGAALRDLGFAAATPSGGALGRNLAALIEEQTASFNPLTRLMIWRARARVAAPAEALSARILTPDTPDSANAFVQIRPAGTGRYWLNGSAILNAGQTPETVVMRLDAWGEAILDASPPPQITRQTAGMLSLEPAGETMEFVAWTQGVEAAVSPAPARPVARTPGPLPGLAFAAIRFARDVGRIGLGDEQAFASVQSWLGAGPTSRKLAKLKDRHAGETAWIVGNGPSVRIEDLDRLAGRLVFTFNRFHLAHPTTRLRAPYTLSGDAQMIEDFGQSIVDESGGTVFIAHHRPPDLLGDYVWLRQAPVYPPLFSKRADHVVSPGGSTPYVAMQVAWFMGVRRFYFYGADFTFRFAGAKGGGVFRSAAGEGNHFIANYRSGLPWCPPSLIDIGSAFLNARLIMEAEGGFVRNATRGGALEIFPREDFDAALGAA